MNAEKSQMINPLDQDIECLYNESIKFVNSHYENFPVLSFFVPKELRKHVAVIYQFARQADDIADEGTRSEEDRLIELNEYEFELKDALDSKYKNGFWNILKLTIENKKLSNQNFLSLLKAFKQDTEKKRYKNFDELMNYCNNSANPIGRLILELYDQKTEVTVKHSDQICTALQLTNFYQDVSVDIKKGRIYLPQEEMQKFNITEIDISELNFSNAFRELLKFQVIKTEKLFCEGRKILKHLPFRLKFQLLVTIKGGEAILKKIKNIDYNVLEIRPNLDKMDFIKLFLTAILLRR